MVHIPIAQPFAYLHAVSRMNHKYPKIFFGVEAIAREGTLERGYNRWDDIEKSTHSLVICGYLRAYSDLGLLENGIVAMECVDGFHKNVFRITEKGDEEVAKRIAKKLRNKKRKR